MDCKEYEQIINCSTGVRTNFGHVSKQFKADDTHITTHKNKQHNKNKQQTHTPQ